MEDFDHVKEEETTNTRNQEAIDEETGRLLKALKLRDNTHGIVKALRGVRPEVLAEMVAKLAAQQNPAIKDNRATEVQREIQAPLKALLAEMKEKHM